MKIHFIGIGGIGVSALARYYLALGHKVSGSDLVSSEITDALRKKGAKIFIGKHRAKNLPKDADLVIYSPAVQPNNSELLKAKSYKLKAKTYPEALGELTKKYFTIAVCGSHGKSTVAAMIGLILTKAGLNPTVILGTKLREFGDSNFRIGGLPKLNNKQQTANSKQFLVIEADEYKESFLNYWPKIIVLLNIEYDHPDYFKNLNHYILAYKKFVSHLPKDGTLIINKDNKNLNSTFFAIAKNAVYYSLKQREAKKLRKILKVPGEFNVSNALAALAVARVLKIPDKISFKALSQFKGTWRRFDEKIAKIPNTKYPIRIITDYAHHPTQIKVTLKTAREKYPKKKIWCIFQPHQYQRTYYLWNDFVKVFKEAPVDKLIITDIYDVAGREEKKIKEKIDSKKLVKEVEKENVIYLPKEKIINYLKKNLEGGEVVMIMGAGDIYNLI
jgi:UDP-N-acetylmuramate--alanine ligase